MALNLTFTLNVPALPNTGIWFANAAAWSAYWDGVAGSATLDPVPTLAYVEHTMAAAVPAVMQIDGVDYVLATKAMWDDLKTKVDTLNTGFKQLKSDLKDGGLITNE